jgi:hypothetical protein
MLDALLLSVMSDPLEEAIEYHRTMTTMVEEQAQDERLADAETVSRDGRTPLPTGDLPPLLAFIRSNESGGDYAAYNPTGCEGWGCGGAFQLHAQYASTWAASAGNPGLGSNAAAWAPATQDRVAVWLFYSTNPDGAHWCAWTDYC